MSTATTLTDSDLSTNAHFQALMGWVDSNIQSFGLVYTAQTGDIDPSVASSPTAGTFAGFRCYKSNDGLTDYYIRIDFGVSIYNNKGIRMKYQVGTTVNGSGTLGGQVGTAQIVESNQNTNTTTRQYMSGSAGRLAVALDGGNSNINGVNFSIGRTVDTSGNATSTGIETWQMEGGFSGATLAQYVPFSGSVQPAESGGFWPVCYTAASPANVGGSNQFGIPQMYNEVGAGLNPTLCVAVTDGSTLTKGTTVTLTLYGTSHTYLVTGNGDVCKMNAAHRGMIRYE